MFKKKRGRPSNAYKRKVKTMKILSLASIIAISGITIYGLSGYIKGNNDRLGASVTAAKHKYSGDKEWVYYGKTYYCEGDYTRYGDIACAKYTKAKVGYTCNTDLMHDSDPDKFFYDGYVIAEKSTCATQQTIEKKHCVKCSTKCDNGDTFIGNNKCRSTNKSSTQCTNLNGKYDNKGVCTYSSANEGQYFGKIRKTIYYCKDKEVTDNNQLTINDIVETENNSCVSSIVGAKIKETKPSQTPTPTDSGNSPTPTNTGETPTNDGKTDDSNDTPSEQNNDKPSNEEKPKELPELKIISSNGTNLTNKEYSRNLCTNSPFYISGAKVSEVSIKSDKLKITNSLEKTSTDKAIIEPSKEIKKGEKVQITVTRTEDKKEAKVTFVNNTDCESLKVCKKLGKININHGMTIMDKKVITLKQDAYFGLNLWVYPINVKEKSSKIKWESSNPNVVEIIKKSDQGIQIHAKAKSNKTVKISASLGGKTTYFKVKVNAKKGKNNPGGYDNAPKMVNCEEKKSIEKAKIENIPDQEYTGKVITPTIKVSVDSKELKNGTDYELVYSNNVNPGTAKVRIIGKGLYTRSKVVTFTIKSSEEKISRITVSKKTRNLSDEKCSTDPLKVTFTNVEDINIEDVYYSTDNGAKWNVLNSEKEGPNATITLNKTYNYLLIKVKDEEGNYSKIYGPYNINIQKSCNTLKKVTTIKISGIKKENKLTKRIKVKVVAKSNIKTIQISTDGKKTWVVSKKCTINKNEATCNIDSKHKSLYYRVITVNNEYQDFGEYKVK